MMTSHRKNGFAKHIILMLILGVITASASYYLFDIKKLISTRSFLEWARYLPLIYLALLNFVFQVIGKYSDLADYDKIDHRVHERLGMIVQGKIHRMWILFIFFLGSALFSIAASLAKESTTNLPIYLSVTICVLFVWSLFSIILIVGWFKELRVFKWNASNSQRKLEEKKAFLESIKKDSSDKTLDHDEHLNGYNNPI